MLESAALQKRAFFLFLAPFFWIAPKMQPCSSVGDDDDASLDAPHRDDEEHWRNRGIHHQLQEDQQQQQQQQQGQQQQQQGQQLRQEQSLRSSFAMESATGGGGGSRRYQSKCGGAAPLVSPWLARHLTYGRLHLAYFIVISCIATAFLWCFPKHGAGLEFIDAMFNAVSSACTTGLISVRMRTFSHADDILLMTYMILGSTITTALIPVFIRRYQFARNIQHLEATIQRQHRRVHPAYSPAPALPPGIICRAKKIAAAATEESSARRRQDKLDSMKLEADALTALCWIVSAFFLATVVIGFFVLEMLILASPAARSIIASNHVHHVYFSLFTAISSLTNSGILLLDENMVPLRGHWPILLWMSFLILIGNTMFAPCLRATIVLLRRFSRSPQRAIILDFLLDNPRKCFTHLFPKSETLWLVFTVMVFNALESGAFYIFSWNSPKLQGLSVWIKIVNGIFQSITTRSAGLNVVPIGSLSPPMLILYIGMMYIAVYPVYLTRQKSQAPSQEVEEDKYGARPAPASKKKKSSNLLSQSRKLVARDSAYLFIIVFLLCIIENKRIQTDPLNFSIFNVIFEAISAYGNVGLSVGYSCSLYTEIPSNASQQCEEVPYSFSGTWSVCGKLLMIVIMLMGRNRGLPDDMDMAVQLPKGFDEEVEEQIQMHQQLEQLEQIEQQQQQFDHFEQLLEQQQQQQQIEMLDLLHLEQEQHKPLQQEPEPELTLPEQDQSTQPVQLRQPQDAVVVEIL